MAALTERADWPRLSLDADVVVLRRRPILSFGGVPVVPPPGVFVQAVREAQEVMQEIVVKAAGRAKHIADLFAGVGTLTLPLAKRGRVSAIDSDAAALGALDVALRESQGIKPVETKVRDLYATPLARRNSRRSTAWCSTRHGPGRRPRRMAREVAGSRRGGRLVQSIDACARPADPGRWRLCDRERHAR